MKNEILSLYFDKKIAISKIAKMVSKSRTSIYEILKKDERYEVESQRRRKLSEFEIAKKEEKITRLFYEKRLKVYEIAGIFNISNATVTKVIKKDLNYKNEKARRKGESRKINREKSKLAIKKKRGKIREEELRILLKLQKQNAIDMSRMSKLSTKKMVEMNLNHYKYNPISKSLEFVEASGSKPNDLPYKVILNERQ
ncbi:helix-turn-helix domain-containing protein [Clostridium felsineum]|uniref:hypothetical protein n=1 Tax=Clostridium felsineum TaxID=36839 RepID=UPI00098C8909|nr:hypothetical protein [Clostridium felsineum]MCR3760195.1 helix-turn-helix domain-containing protein [Clostridium felsineum]URZ16337.1 hypothetical protein CLFE_023840 [Clostridium felsineum DSM 794]